jgi:hypothetical protein
LIVVGEAPSEHLNYYAGYDTITQNSTGDILLDCQAKRVQDHVTNSNYQAQFLHDDGLDHEAGLYYIGSLHL